ncbi:MAG: PLP-dependent aminotransferase family protein [Lautropia sp.]
MTQARTRIDQVMDAVRSRIASRSIPPGARLPSVRAQARATGFSVSTVVQAYERLAAEGLVIARRGAGFYLAGPVAPLALSEIGPRREREVDPLWISREALAADDGVPMPGCGWLPPDWMFEAGMRRALRAIARADASVLTGYATPAGLPALREVLARRMASFGIDAPPGQIVLTESGTQAIDLICRLLLEPGDTVLVDDPCYFNFHALLRAHRAKIVGVPFTPEGPDLGAFEKALHEHAPRLYVTNGGIHNPTGAILSPASAHRLLRLADDSKLVIVEDDIFADLEIVPAARLAALDGLSRVIHIGSFSKTLSASLRCGYVAARADWIDALVDLKIATSFGGGRLAAAVLLAALTDGAYRRHLETLRGRLAGAMQRTIARLDAVGIVPWTVPRAGMFVWGRLPTGVDATALARSCLREGVVLAPGNAFSESRDAAGFVRFNVAQCEDTRVFEVLRRALSA